MILKNEKINNSIYQTMNNLTEDELIEIVKKNPIELKNINNQTDKICLEAVKQDRYALRYVKNQSESIALEAVKENGYALQHVKNQTDEICLEAVKQNGDVLRFVKNQTDEICLKAVKQFGWALEYVINQNNLIVLEAINQNFESVEYINIKIKSIYEFLKINHYIIYFLKDCDSYDYMCIMCYLLNNTITSHKKIDKSYITTKHTIGYVLKNYDIDDSFITIFINFLIQQHQYSVLKSIRMEQPFYNSIKK